MKGKKLKVTAIISLVLILLAIITTIYLTWQKTSKAEISPELLRSMEYNELQEDTDYAVDGTENVKFWAFFTKDLNGDGIAEKLDGTCNSLGSTPTLYMDLNVLGEGYLKDGKIIINGTNFNYKVNMVKDQILKNNLISDNVTEIEFNDVNAGTQKLIFGKLLANIANNINNYSNISSITLTGTHIIEDENGNVVSETPINKTCNLTVDWYGDVSSSLYTYSSVYTYYYDALESNEISFNFYVREDKQELLLKDCLATATIPELNGFKPISVTSGTAGVTAEYDEETGVVTLTKSSVVNESGLVTSSLGRTNTFNVKVQYPQEAYDSITTATSITVPITGQYVGYNTTIDQFESPKYSNISTGKVVINFIAKPDSVTYHSQDFYVSIASKKYVYKPSNRYTISKQDLLNLYDNDDYEGNYKYTISWSAYSGNYQKINSYVMSETKEEEAYGDKFDSIVLDEYTLNKGIYFANATNVLGEEGEIKLYNNDTNELIHTFTKDDWEKYNSSNLYSLGDGIKHIRIETSEPSQSTTLIVYSVKEFETQKITENFTKEEIQNANLMYTYLTGVADIEEEGKKTTNKQDSAYLISETSDPKISLSTESITSQESVNEKIYIETVSSQYNDAKWKNGEFVVEVPKEIINMEINNISINDNKVKVKAYDLYKEDGKYLIRILTENSEKTTYTITIDTNMTPDPRLPTSNVNFKLYAYNQACNDYYNTTQDTYDVDEDNNTEELVGTSSANLHIDAPTGIVTLQTITNYNEAGDKTIAPNVAGVERETKQATINVNILNNYPNTISGVIVVGRMPFEGNKLVINNKKSLNSQFTTTITSDGVKASEGMPSGVTENVEFYYSENENATKDLENNENGWKKLEDIEDFSKIKSYLIVLKNYTIKAKEEVKFEYNVTIPENIDYNKVAFSTHAVYYDFDTEDGSISLATEPEKVGLKIVDKYDLELTKYKLNSNIVIPGVTYGLTCTEPNETGTVATKTRLLTTNSEGKVSLKDLNVGIEYTLKEIKVPDTCELNEEEVKFIIDEKGEPHVTGTTKSNEFTENKTLKIALEDEVKYKMQINKTKVGGTTPINNVRFALEYEDGAKVYARTSNGGIATFEGLSLNTEYTLTETGTTGSIEKNEGTYKFKLVRNENGGIDVVSTNSLISGIAVVTDEGLTPILTVNVQDEIKYSLVLNKEDKDGNKIQGAQFTIKGKGFNENGTICTSTKEGKVNISGLYVGETYTIEETKAIGYYLDSTKNNKITLQVTRNGALQVSTWDTGDLEGAAASISEDGLIATVTATIKNEKIPTYSLNIIKENKNGETLAGAQFKLTSLDTGIEQILTSDENGKITFEGLYEYIAEKGFVSGEYTLQEIYAPEGYSLDTHILKFKATREEGKVVFEVLENGESIKIDSETGDKVITSNEESATITLINKPIFKLTKYGDNNTLLPNAKFAITDLDGNKVQDVKGNDVGEAEEINGTTYYVVKTNEDGEISANLPEGYYKAVEIEAPEGYELESDESKRTYYFGIGASRPQETSGTVDTLNWSNSIKSELISEFNDAIETEDGGIIAVGSVSGESNVNTTNYGYKDGIIVKYDKNGEVVYSTVLGGINDDEITAIAKVSDGYVIAGNSDSDTIYYNGTEISLAGYGNSDGFIIKINENGDQTSFGWAQSIGGTGIDKIYDIAVNDNGYIGITGSYDSETLTLDASDTLTNLGLKDGFVAVYNSAGELSWAQNIGGTNDVYGSSIIATSNGWAVSVNFLGAVNVNTAGTATLTSAGDQDSTIITYTNEGDYSNSKQIGTTSNNSNAIYDMVLAKVDEETQIIAVGAYSAANSSLNLSTKGNFDGMILKFTEGLEFKKSMYAGGSSDDVISSIYQTADEGLFFGGWTYSGTMTGTYSLGTSNSGVCDGFVAKINKEDELEWKDSIKGTDYDIVQKVLQAPNGGYVALGKYWSKSLTVYNKTNTLIAGDYGAGFAVEYGEKVTSAEIPETQEIKAKNKLKQFNITTEIGLNIQNERTGGTITGKYNGDFPASNYKQFVESVKYGEDSTKEIVITPKTDYVIKKVTINGEEITVNVEADGSYTIPAGYFENITEDKHIVVVFANVSHAITIEKKDESGNPLKGASFEINSNNDTPVFGELTANGAAHQEVDETKEVAIDGTLTDNGSTYTVADKTNDVTSEVLGTISDNGNTYTFTDNGEGSYVSSSSMKQIADTANSYFEIDLTGKTGDYVVVVNANVSSRANYDFGYATIMSSNTSAPVYSSTSGRFIYISGTTATATTPTDYISTKLEGGSRYYLYLGYRKAATSYAGNDEFTINSINVYGATTSEYSFTESNGVYTPNNLDSAIYYNGTSRVDTVANSYIPIDLTGKEGTYFITVNAEASSTLSTEYLYATVNQSTTAPTYSNGTGRFVYMYNTAATTYKSINLEGGQTYYLHLGYVNSSSGTTRTVKINSINLYKTSTYYFEENEDGKYISNNVGKNGTYAYSYIPLDLTDYPGEYKITVNADIAATTSDYGFVTVKEDITAPAYNYTTNRMLYISGNRTNQEGTLTVKGGTKYYIHLGYYNNTSNTTLADTFTINSITVEPVEKTYTATTNENGQAIVEVEYSGKYTIQETEAPEHYMLDDSIQEFELLSTDKNKTLEITNKRNPSIIVHHYLKGTEQKVAEDELTEGLVGDEYITTAHDDLEGLTLQKDTNGEYVIPENASGTYKEGLTEITYYYEAEPLKLTIHHYLEGTEDKLAEDEYVYTNATVTFDEDGNYEVSATNTYKLEDNTNYSNLINEYKFAHIIKDNLELDISDELTYNTNTEISYYYYIETKTVYASKTWVGIPDGKMNNYRSTFKVYENIETADTQNEVIERNGKQYALVESIPAKTIVGNGSISYNLAKMKGETEREYIIIETKAEKYDEETSTWVELVENQDFEKEEEGTSTINTMYYKYEVHYLYNNVEDEELKDEFVAKYGTEITEVTDKVKEGLTKEKVTSLDEDGEEKETNLVIKVDESKNVIYVYYVNRTDLQYIVNYLEKGTNEVIHEQKVEGNKTFKEVITSASEVIDIDGYNYDSADKENITIEVDESKNVINLYYTKRTDLGYKVNYLEKGTNEVIHEQKVEGNKTFKEVITSASEVIDIDGYNYDSADKENIAIEVDESQNVINLYYTKRTDLGYKVNYLEKGTNEVIHEQKVGGNKTFKEVITSASEIIDIDGYNYDSADKENITIEVDESKNIINLYYTKRTDLSYKVNYLEKGTNEVLHESKTVGDKTLNEVVDATQEIIDIVGYDYDSIDKNTLTIEATNNVINIYYNKAKLGYTVHYFYDGVEDPTKVEQLEAKYQDKITTYTDKAGTGIVKVGEKALDENGEEQDLPLTIKVDESKNVINVYYRSAYKITTDVIEHTEEYQDGTVKTKVKGGTISGEDLPSYENVLKGDDSTKSVVIKPDDGYEITSIKITDGTETIDLDITSFEKATDGSITLNASNGYFKDMRSDKHIEVEFRKKTSVVVKYLEKGTNKVLAEQVEISGIEGEEFNTERKVVTDYRAANVETSDGSKAGVTYENMKAFDETAENTMFADTTTIIYWYEKIPEGTIIVRHIEVDEKDIEKGLTLTSGTELSSESYTGKVDTTQLTARKELTDSETERKYISVSGPTSTSSNVIIVKEDANTYTAKFVENDADGDGVIDTIEVRYYYEKQYTITTEVKPHTENGTEVKGGTITGDKNELTEEEKLTNPEGIYETINNKGTNAKEIVIAPETNYKVKSLTINGKEVDITKLEDENHRVVIPSKYFEEVSEDKVVVVEFEKIPAKVIVKYLEIGTNKELKEQDIEIGTVGEEYKTERTEIAGYEKAGEEPNNAKGIMTEEDIIVIYYYKKVETKPAEPEDKSKDNKPETPTEGETTNTPNSNKDIQNQENADVDTTNISTGNVQNVENIKTGDNILLYVTAFILMVIVLTATEFTAKKIKK